MDTLTPLPPAPQTRRSDDPFHVWTSDGSDWVRFYRDDAGFLLRFPGLADFVLSPDGQSATCHPTHQADAPTLEFLYQNHVVPMMLSVRGARVYHGAAIEHQDGAIALLGPSGHGKSSLAASFVQAGHPFLTDDLLVLEPQDDLITVLPGVPSLRLWPSARTALLGDDCTRAPKVSYTDKERVLAGRHLTHSNIALPLRAAIILSDDTPKVAARPLSGADAVAAWMANVFVLEIDRADPVRKAFYQTAAIARAVPTIALDYPRNYDALPRVRRTILAKVAELTVKGAGF